MKITSQSFQEFYAQIIRCSLFTVLTVLVFLLPSQAQMVSRKFVNTQDQPLTLYIATEASNGQQTIKQTIDIDQHNGSFRTAQVEVGDYVWAEIKGNPSIKTDRIFINGTRMANEEIFLSPQLAFLDFYGKLGNNNQTTRFLGVAYNLYGVDITQYQPRRVIDGFTSNQIFKGLGNEKRPSATRGYYLQKGTGTVLPTGFLYTGADSDQDGKVNTSEYFSSNTFKKAWNLSLGASGTVKGVSPSVDFSYGEEFEKSQNQSYVYYIKEQKNKEYAVGIDLNTVEFDNDFIRAIAAIKTQNDADQFVERYGSHFPRSITYGSRYSHYTSVTKTDYFEAKRKNLNLKVAVSAGKTDNTREYTDKTPKQDIKEIVPGASKSVSGSVGFSLNESRELQEIMSNSTSRYYAIGGLITPDQQWSAAGTNTAIELDLEEISILIDAKILKSRLTPADLAGKKVLVANAVQKKKNSLKQYEDRLERSFEIQVTDIRITNHIDDAQKAGKGYIYAKVMGTNDTIPLFEVRDWTNGFNHDWKIHFSDPNEENLITRTWYPIYQVADENGNFAPLMIDFSAQIWDRDDCCGDEMAELHWGQLPTRALVTNQPLIHKLAFKDIDHLVLQDWAIEATITIRPTDPVIFASQNRSATNIATATPPGPQLVKFQPPTMDEQTFKDLAMGSSNTPSAPVTINGKNASSVVFSQGGTDVGTFTQMAGTKNWTENTMSGQARFNYQETGRDEWSVYLYDATRKVRIALDLFQKKVKYSGPSDTSYRVLYPISAMK